MKYLLIPVTLLFIGCSDEPTPVYDEFVKKHGANHRFYCDESGFLIEEIARNNYDHISRYLVKNDADVPTRCNVENTSIQVKETVATGALSGSVQ